MRAGHVFIINCCEPHKGTARAFRDGKEVVMRKWESHQSRLVFSCSPNAHPRSVPVFLTASFSCALHTFLVHLHTFFVQCHEAAMTLLPPLDRADLPLNESSTLDVRTFNITLNAPASDFQITDLPRQRGVIDALDAELKQAVKGATESYLKAAETLI